MPKISSLTNEAVAINSADWFVVEQGGVTKKARGAIVGGGGGGGFSSQNIKVDSQSLGGVVAGTLTFFAVTSIFQRGLVSRLKITPSGLEPYDIEIYDAGSQTANKMLLAYDIYGNYEISAPWYLEVASGQGSTIQIGIRNLATVTRSYYISNLRAERFA